PTTTELCTLSLHDALPIFPGDSWDYDSVQGFILADLTINGRQRKVLMQANKDGFYYVLDRLTGAFISAQPFAQVTWAKGIDQERSEEHTSELQSLRHLVCR